MKNLTICLLVILIFNACNSRTKRTEPIDTIAISDSIVNLILKFQSTQDTSLLRIALSLNDSLISEDILNTDRYYNLYTRMQIMALLGRFEEAFILRDSISSRDTNNLDRLIYTGLKYKHRGDNDSSMFYFNKALLQCNKELQDSINTNVVMSKVTIYIYSNRETEALNFMDSILLIQPDNIVVETFRDDFEFYSQKIKDFYESLK